MQPPPDPRRIADKALEDCGGDRDAALLLLAHLLVNARRGVSPGFLRLGPQGRP